MEQQILVENETHLDVQAVEQPLVSISEPTETELVALSVEQDVKVIQEESAVLLVLTEGGSLYKNAVNNGFSGTELEWMTELLDSKASVQFVVTTMADGNTAYASALLALKAEVGSTYATNIRLSEVIAQRDLARALDKHILESKISSDIFASNQTILETMATGNLALSQRINTLDVNLGGLGARVNTVEIAIVTEGSARAAAIQALNASLNGRIDAELLTVNEVIVDATGALANQITTLETNFNNRITSELQSVNSAISNEAGARAAQINTLRADFTTGLTAALTSIDEVSVDVNGNALAISQLSGVVSNPSTGLSAAFTRANQAYTLADNTAGSLSTISGIVQHPTTGLAATYAFAQQVEINANNNTASSINSLRNEITAPNASWTANNTFIQSIQTTAGNALTNAATAQTAANNAATAASTANTELAAISSDSILSKGEKPAVVLNVTNILNEQAGIVAEAVRYGIVTPKTNYTTAVSNLTAYLATLTPAYSDVTQNTPIVANTFKDKFADVYTKRQVLLDAIVAAAKALADNAQNTASYAVGLVTTLENNLESTVSGYIANNTLVLGIQDDLAGNINATSTLSSAVSSLDAWKTNTATVQLTALTSDVGTLESRAFIGVTSVSGGKAVVAGLTVNSVNNGIIMRGNVFGLENVAGTPVLYWSDSDNTLNIKARLVLSGGETITSVNDIKAYDAIVVVLEKEGRILSADSAGTVSSYVGSSNIISVYQGTTELQYETGTGNPTTNGRFRVVVSASNITAGAISASGLKASMANTSAMTADNATITYTINIRNNAGVVSSIVKTYSLAKSRQGVAGTGGIDGTIGAGFYGSTYSAIDWTTATANSRFTTLVGRSPVQYDIFIQTRIDGTDSQARQYNGSSWVTVALQVNGSIIASGTIAGDKIIAGTSISAPVINTPTIKGGNIQLIGSNYMKIQSATPFGPHNLVEWRGPKVAGVTWNNATQSPIYTNITKSNAIEYADDNGNVYFGGTITAGTLRNALQTTLVTTNPVIETGYFSSNGNVITVLVSFDSSIGENNLTGGTCPVQGQPNGVLYLDKWNGSTWVQVAMQPIYGMYECNVEPGGYVASWFLSGSFTYYDTTGTTENRRYRARGTLNGMPLLAGTFSSLSILTEE